MKIEDLEKALQYFVIAVPESEEQAKAYFWARKALTALRSMQEARETFHIDRNEWTAEWIYPENEWNLPRCSKCGCNSKDATYGHKNNFCPKCGRAMTEEAWAELERRVMR